MTSDELHRWFSDTYGLHAWPATFNVTAETYGNVCHAIVTNEIEKNRMFTWDVNRNGTQKPDLSIISIGVGPNKGIMFKGVELILENFDNPLQKEMLDLITLMPDSQTQELIDYILDLRKIRGRNDNTDTDMAGGGTGEARTDGWGEKK